MIDYCIPGLYNVIKSFKKTFISKHRAKLKMKAKYTDTQKTKTERRKPSFTKRIDRKCRLI